jgi:hypothetical protein
MNPNDARIIIDNRGTDGKVDSHSNLEMVGDLTGGCNYLVLGRTEKDG